MPIATQGVHAYIRACHHHCRVAKEHEGTCLGLRTIHVNPPKKFFQGTFPWRHLTCLQFKEIEQANGVLKGLKNQEFKRGAHGKQKPMPSWT